MFKKLEERVNTLNKDTDDTFLKKRNWTYSDKDYNTWDEKFTG